MQGPYKLQKARRRDNPQTRPNNPTATFRFAPPKFWSIVYKFPGEPGMYRKDGGLGGIGGGGQYWVGGFFGVGGGSAGGDGGGGHGGGGDGGGGLCMHDGVHLTP